MASRHFFLIVLVAAVLGSEKSEAWCPEDWVLVPGVGCFLASDVESKTQVHFNEARRICHDLGASLVSLTDDAKRSAIEDIMRVDWGHYWVGAEFNHSIREFVWDDGTHLEKRRVKGRALADGRRTCVTYRSIMKFPHNLQLTDDKNPLEFRLHADPCDISQRFICEKRNVTATPEPTTAPPETTTTPMPHLEPSSVPVCEPKIITVTVTETVVSSIIVAQRPQVIRIVWI